MMRILIAILVINIALKAQDLSGRVVLKGAKPSPEVVKVTQDRSICGIEKVLNFVEIGKDNGIKNVVVWLDVKDAQKPKPSSSVLDQIKCQFKPFITLLPVGSELIIRNSDKTLHNAHGFWLTGSKGTAFNVASPIPGLEVKQKLKRAGTIRVKCDAGHTWMEAYIVVCPHKYYTLTKDDGSFSFSGVQPGEYKLHVWHPKLGEKIQKVKVPGKVEIVFETKK